MLSPPVCCFIYISFLGFGFVESRVAALCEAISQLTAGALSGVAPYGETAPSAMTTHR